MLYLGLLAPFVLGVLLFGLDRVERWMNRRPKLALVEDQAESTSQAA